ncbi:unnamed protein product [Camellia sinensis]
MKFTPQTPTRKERSNENLDRSGSTTTPSFPPNKSTEATPKIRNRAHPSNSHSQKSARMKLQPGLANLYSGPKPTSFYSVLTLKISTPVETKTSNPKIGTKTDNKINNSLKIPNNQPKAPLMKQKRTPKWKENVGIKFIEGIKPHTNTKESWASRPP